MQTLTKRCELKSSDQGFLDITYLVAEQVGAARIREGRAAVFSLESGSTLFVNENEAGLRSDLERAFALLPQGTFPGGGSRSVVLPIADECIVLGDWQLILVHRATPAQPLSVVVQVTGV